MPKTLTLSLDPHLASFEATRVLDDIRNLEGVTDAGLIAPDSKNDVARSIAYVMLDPASDTDLAAKKVGEVQGVISCDVPPTRHAL